MPNNAKSVSDTATLPQCSSEKAQSASHSLPVTNLLLPQKAQSALQERQTKSAKLPSKSSSTDLEKTRLSSSLVSTASLMFKPRWTISPVKLKLSKKPHTPTASVRQSECTAQTTSPKALQSCVLKTWTFPSPATPPTPLVSNTPSQALTKNGALTTAKNTSPSHPAVARAVLFTPTTWQQVPHLTA